MIQDLRKEAYFGEDTPLVPDEYGNYTRPVNFRKRYYRILAAAGIEKKGLHGEWDKAGGRLHKVSHASPGSGLARPQHFTNY